MRSTMFGCLLLASTLWVSSPLSAADKALVFVAPEQKAAMVSDLRARGGAVREIGDALELDADLARKLASTALRIDYLPEPWRVQLASGEVDLRTLAVDFGKNPERRRPLIVAAKGVPDAEFSDCLRAAGAAVVGTLPPTALVVRANAKETEKLSACEQVAVVVGYQDAWKRSSRLLRGPLAALSDIVIFEGADAAPVTTLLEDMGIPFEVIDIYWRKIVRAELPTDQIDTVASMPEVEQIEGVVESEPLNNEVRVVMQTTKAHFMGNQAFYNPVYRIGVWGASQLVTVADTGLAGHEVFAQPGKTASVVPTGTTCAIPIQGDAGNHGTGVASTLLGDRTSFFGFGFANDFDGLSLRSLLLMQDMEDDQRRWCPPADPTLNLFFPALLAGSRIHNNSWGTNGSYGYPSMAGTYTWVTQAIDKYLHFDAFREQSVIFAAGNAGGFASGSSVFYRPFTLSDESHSKNAIVVGGSRNGLRREQMYTYSSRGPTNDCLGALCPGLRRVKPDVVAPASTTVDTADTASFTAYSVFNGTSIAAPAVAGAAALVRDYFAQGRYPVRPTDPPLGGPASSALVKAMLINSTVPLTDTAAFRGNAAQGLSSAAYPNYDQGYGRPTLDNVLEPAGYKKLVVFENDSTQSKTGDVWSATVDLTQLWNASCNHLRVTLAWNDEAGSLIAGSKLVNDLDLEVKFDGRTWRGNHLLTGGLVWDRANNVEDVYIPRDTVAPGTTDTVKITVYGSSVPVGPQPWAVVLTYGPCADNIPCEPGPLVPGCYMGPRDIVPTPGYTYPRRECTDQKYDPIEYTGSPAAFPYCGAMP